MNEDFQKLKGKGLTNLKNRKYIKAVDYLEKALSIKYNEELSKSLAEASYKAIWEAYTSKKFEKMERAANLSISIYSKEESYNPLRLAKSYNGLSIALYTLGKPTIEHNLKAKDLYNDLLSKKELTLSKKKQILRSKVYNDIGIIMNIGFLGKLDEASLICEEDISLCIEYKINLELGVIYKVYAELLYFFDKKEESLSYFREALKVLLENKKDANYRHHIGDIYLKVSSHLLQDGDLETTLATVTKAAPYLNDVRKNEFRYYYIKAVIYEKYGELKKAKEHYLRAFDMLMGLRSSIETGSNIDGFLKKQEREMTFKKAININFKMDDYNKALELLEKYKGKEFIEKVLEGKRSVLLGIPVGLRNERNNIEKEIEITISDKKLNPEEKAIRISHLEDRLYYCEEKIAASKKVYKLFGESINIELKDIIYKIQDKLKPKQNIVSYFYHDNGIRITLIKKNKLVNKFVEIDKEDFEDILKNYIDLVRKYYSSNKSTLKIISYYHKRINEFLLKPIINNISYDIELIIIPFETLHIFPIHIFYLDAYPNINISYMSSIASILYIDPKKEKLNDICIYADPRSNLPSVKNEVNNIPKFFADSKILYKEEASKEAFLNNWDRYDAFHYSGHFRYKNNTPLYSYIECSNYEKITLSKIYELSSQKVSFLSLGGCSSGVSRIYKGEELTGMIRGFFYTGIKSILATLWDVEDRSASDFLVTFYERMQNYNGDKKKAFSQTYNLIKEKYKYIFFYAPFVLYEGLY